MGELGQLDNHINSNPSQQNQLEGCQFTYIKCYCTNYFQRSNPQVHQSEQCPWRPYSCEYCRVYNSSHRAVTTNHWLDCGYYPLPCLNKCGDTLQRQSMANHITISCPLTIIDCEFRHAGCQVRLPHKDMVAHLNESFVVHLSLETAHHKHVVHHPEQENEQLKL